MNHGTSIIIEVYAVFKRNVVGTIYKDIGRSLKHILNEKKVNCTIKHAFRFKKREKKKERKS